MFCCFGCFSTGRKSRFFATDGAMPPETAAVALPMPVQFGGQRWIDIHCHLFNIVDLPALDFIERTRLTMPPPLNIGAVLALLPIIGGLNGMAMTAEAELASLQSGRTGRLMAGAGPELNVGTLTTLRVIDGRESLGTESMPQSAPLFAELMPDPLTATHQRPSPPKNGAVLVRDAVNEIIPTRRKTAPVTEDELRQLADHIDRITNGGAQPLTAAPAIGFGADTAPGATPDTGALTLSIGSYLGWGQEMARPRNRLAGDLLSQFPANADVLMTPALVDYSRWLGIRRGDHDPLSNLDTQLAVMFEISNIRAVDPASARKAGLLCFAPFDPWRMAEDTLRNQPTLLDRLKPWVAAGKVIGVKLYPPMGFRPAGNARRDITEFPDDLVALAGGGHPGKLLDDALTAVFTWCESEGVAVMCHSGNSNESRPGYGLLAGPQGWSEVLAAHPKLRLNLGHFGGVFGFGSSKASEREACQAWARAITSMMGTYANLYADIGFASQLLEADYRADDECGVTLSFLEGLANDRPVLRTRLMYGSDWVMVGMVDDSDQYASRIQASMARIFPGLAMDDFRWRNAARFLGLGVGQPARRRIARFLDPVAPGFLARFDPDQI